jgi:hypothetical protein
VLAYIWRYRRFIADGCHPFGRHDSAAGPYVHRQIAAAHHPAARARPAGFSRRNNLRHQPSRPHRKLDLYAKFNVAEYWIVDPATQLIDFLVNENGKFVVQSARNDSYQSPNLPEVMIQVADFWREVDREMSGK